jgi:hypothetical protein
MNIFAIAGDEFTGDVDWIQSARDLDNLRVVKMILESCQILSTVLNEQGLKAPYRSFNPKHPSCLWAAESSENFENLILHCSAMLEEYTERFGKIHKCQQVLAKILDMYDPLKFPRFAATPLRLAMPEQFRSDNPVKSYRDYYSQKDNMRYPKEKIPAWLKKRRRKKMIII